MGASSHRVEGRGTDAGHDGSRRAPQSETSGKPDFCPALSPSGQVLGTILPWLSLSCSFWVGGGTRAQPLPWLTGGDAAVCRLSKRGGGINTGVCTYTRRKTGCMLGVYFSLSILFSSKTSSQSAILGIRAGPLGSEQMQVWVDQRGPRRHLPLTPPECPGKPMTLRNWVPPSSLGPHNEGVGPQVSSPL